MAVRRCNDGVRSGGEGWTTGRTTADRSGQGRREAFHRGPVGSAAGAERTPRGSRQGAARPRVEAPIRGYIPRKEGPVPRIAMLPEPGRTATPVPPRRPAPAPLLVAPGTIAPGRL